MLKFVDAPDNRWGIPELLLGGHVMLLLRAVVLLVYSPKLADPRY